MDDEEEIAATHHDRIKIVRGPPRLTAPDAWLSHLQACVEAGDVAGALRILQTLVPAYRPSEVVLAATHGGDATDQPAAVAGAL